ncbi:peptidase [Acaryochloris sp. IP29b_bin.137]|uniref:peptidase n=1 Tax=Acaryochloris sp. IP29b_bin.137 TaxID=2969217 RepID=UPI002615BE03|nr:peptidase [Acaryochloris sp. IP29b_bin.137]
MTYCLGVITRYGLVMAADSRTNAGVDYVSTAQKLFDLSRPGERVLLVCTAGNLSMTQSVLTLIRRDRKAAVQGNINELTSMYDIAHYFGEKTREVLNQHQTWLKKDNISADCSFLVGGQLKGELPELYMVYSQGNFLRATRDSPYLQIGEIKYGKPILDRTINYEETSLDAAAKCALLSLDSTMKSNISVGPPINMAMYEADTLKVGYRLKLERGDPYLLRLRKSWETSLRQAFKKLPNLSWENGDGQEQDNHLVMTDILP